MQILCRICGALGVGNITTLICDRCKERGSASKAVIDEPTEINPPVYRPNREEGEGNNGK